MLEEQGTHKVRFVGHLYESFSTRRQRIDVQQEHEHPVSVELLRLFKTKTQYEMEGAEQHCRKLPLNHTMEPAFNWVRHANLSTHECHFRYDNVIGYLWTHQTDAAEAILCVSTKDPNRPYYLEFHPRNRHEMRSIHFRTFVSGNPPDNTFAVPNTCPTENAPPSS